MSWSKKDCAVVAVVVPPKPVPQEVQLTVDKDTADRLYAMFGQMSCGTITECLYDSLRKLYERHKWPARYKVEWTTEGTVHPKPKFTLWVDTPAKDGE